MSLLSPTAHWVDKDLQQQHVFLHWLEMSVSHTAASLAATFDKMVQQWGLDKTRVHIVLRDNATNIRKALDDSDLASLPCMAHTLQLVVNDGLISQQSITDAVATTRNIVGHFKHSALTYSQIHIIQAQLGQPSKRLQQDVSTR